VKTNYNFNLEDGAMLELMTLHAANNVHIWIYSGDQDSSFATVGTQNWINTFAAGLGIRIRR